MSLAIAESNLKLLHKEEIENLDQNGFFTPGVEIKKKSTSFAPDTEEVDVARKHLREGRPTIGYEWVQNVLDYNDWTQGPPQIDLILVDGTRVGYQQMLQMDVDTFRQTAEQTVQLIIINHIQEGKYLSPGNLTQMHHGGGADTLGKYGRGGKAGSAAVLAEGAAQSIRYISRDQRGTWKAECYFADDTDEGQVAPEFSVAHQYLPDEVKVDVTQLIVERPSVALLETFRKIPDFFLPANPAYEHFRFVEHAGLPVKPNLFSVRAERSLSRAKHEVVMTERELREMLGIKQVDETFTEVPRVEILPPGIVQNRSNNRYKDNSICVDGLRLDVNGWSENYALRWSFWGTRNGNNGYKAARSNDSQTVVGSYEQLMIYTLTRCTNSEVFQTIFEASFDGKSCKEGGFDKDSFLSLLKKHPEAVTAFTDGWTAFLKQHELAGKIVVTSSQEVAKKVKKSSPDLIIIVLESEAFSSALVELKIVESASGYYEPEQKMESTGEVQKFPTQPRQPEIVADKVFEAMIDLGGENLPTDRSEITFRLENRDNQKYLTYDMLPERVKEIIRKAAGCYGQEVQVVVRVNIDDEETKLLFKPLFTYSWDRGVLGDGFETVKVTTGSKPTQEESGLIITISRAEKDEGNDDDDEEPDEDDDFSKLIRFYQEKLAILRTESGQIDIDKFLETFKEFSHTAASIALIEQQKEMLRLKRIQRDMERQMGLVQEDAVSGSPTRADVQPRQTENYKTATRKDRRYTTLHSATVGVSRASASGIYGDSKDEEPKDHTTEEMLAELEKKMESLQRPDLQLLNAEKLPAHVRRRLFSVFNPVFSGEITHEPIEVRKRKQSDKPGVIINKALAPGSIAVPVPLECEVIGVYHPDPDVLDQIEIFGSSERLVYSIDSKVDIPPGLELYYRHIGDKKRTAKPSVQERRVVLSKERVQSIPGWSELFDAIQKSVPPLTDKQKVDILSTAWAYTYTYDDNVEVNQLYDRLEGEPYYEQLIRQARGNCAHSAEGFAVLCRCAGIPSTYYSGYLGNNGRFFPGPQNHAQNDVFLSGEWVAIEPQTGIYISSRHQQQKLPGNFAELIRKLPEGKTNPAGVAYQDPLENLGLRKLLMEIIQKGEAGEKLFEMLEQTERLLTEDAGLYSQHEESVASPEVRRTPSTKGVLPQLQEVLKVEVLPVEDITQVQPVINQVLRQLENHSDRNVPAQRQTALKTVLRAVIDTRPPEERPYAFEGVSEGTLQELRKALLQAVNERSQRELSSRPARPTDPAYIRLQRAVLAAQEAVAQDTREQTVSSESVAENAVEDLVISLLSSLESAQIRQLQKDIQQSGDETTPQQLQRLTAQAVYEAERYQERTLYPVRKRESRFRQTQRVLSRAVMPVLLVTTIMLGAYALSTIKPPASLSSAEQAAVATVVSPTRVPTGVPTIAIEGDSLVDPSAAEGETFFVRNDTDSLREGGATATRGPIRETVRKGLIPQTLTVEVSNALKNPNFLALFIAFLLSNGISASSGVIAGAVLEKLRQHRKRYSKG